MEEAEDADEEEDLEEGEKDVGLGGVEQAEGEQGGDATVEDGGADLRHRHDHPLVPYDDDGQDGYIELQKMKIVGQSLSLSWSSSLIDLQPS